MSRIDEIVKRLFPTRLREGTKAKPTPMAGKQKHAKVGGPYIQYPASEDARGRTLRVNAALQAMYSPESAKDSAVSMAMEEARVHMEYAHTKPGSVRRDEMAMALRDLRELKIPRTNAEFEGAMSVLTRAGAILWRDLDKGQTYDPATKTRRPGTYHRAIQYGIDRAGFPIEEELFSALGHMHEGNWGEAQVQLTEMFSIWKRIEEEKDRKRKKAQADIEAEMKKQAREVESTMFDVDYERSCTYSGMTPEPDTSSRPHPPYMRIKHLALDEGRKFKIAPEERTSMSGMRIRAKKLALAVTPSPGRLFKRRIHQQGGTVVIDASGSMALSDAMLRKIADSIPAGKVAYYSDNADQWDSAKDGRPFDQGIPFGTLVIFADNKRQYAKSHGRLPFRSDGNTVDYPALKWLLEQPAPRWFVTDAGFCGGGGNYDDKARRLMLEAAYDRRLTWVGSTEGLLKDLRTKGIMPEGDE